jgi:hypothetical protein
MRVRLTPLRQACAAGAGPGVVGEPQAFRLKRGRGYELRCSDGELVIRPGPNAPTVNDERVFPLQPLSFVADVEEIRVAAIGTTSTIAFLHEEEK